MGNAGYGNHDAPPAGAGAQDRPGPEGGSGEESPSSAALGVSPQDQSMPDPPGGARRSPAMDKGAQNREPPPAGPHADPDLTNAIATPGAGTLPEAGEGDADATSG